MVKILYLLSDFQLKIDSCFLYLLRNLSLLNLFPYL